MNKFARDSVISAYLHLLQKTQSDVVLPEFSEIYLRTALKEVCGKNFALTEDVLQLYRKVLVLYYCEENPSIEPVIKIMERCFVKEEIYNIIQENNAIQGKWWTFQKDYMNIG